MRLIVFAMLALLLRTQEVTDLVCSGFVEFGTEDGVDYSSVEVNLYLTDGQLVERSSCASNGFYMLPISDLKDYYLKVTSKDEILQFKPAQVSLEFSRKTFQEAQLFCEDQLNFKWSGFQLSDRVRVLGEDQNELGQELGGIQLQLSDEHGNIKDTTATEVDGTFTFNDIMPGIHVITPVQNLQNFIENRLTCNVLYRQGKECQGTLTLKGFDVTGVLTSEGQALSHFKLSLINGDYESQAVSNENGQFKFEAIPLGRYQLSFEVSGPLSNRIVEIEPTSVEVSVTGAPLHIVQTLNVNRLSVVGRVADSRNVGVPAVQILLDGSEVAVTDNDGNYELKNVKAGVYTIEANHNHMMFEPLNNLKLSLSQKSIPNFSLKYLHICGQINLNAGNTMGGDDSQLENLKIIVYLENQNEKPEKRSVHTSSEENYKFCFEARPGSYVIYPFVSQQGITWQPKTRQVELQDTPQLNVNFERKIMILGGSVQFLNNIPADLVSQTRIKLFSIKEPSKVLQELALSASQGSYASFQFENVFHGSYQVTLESPLLCFKQTTVPLIITADSSSDVLFIQTGYSVYYSVTQTIPVTFSAINTPSPKESHILVPEEDRACVSVYDDFVVAVDQCFKVDHQKLTYYIAQPQNKVELQIEKIRVQGQVGLQTNVDEELNISLDVSYGNQRETIELKGFEFEFYADLDTFVTIQPRFSTEATHNLLFEPRVRTLNVRDQCITSKVTFELNTGFVFQVNFDKSVPEVSVSVTHGQETIENQVTSLERLKLGPYIEQSDYQLSFEKEGYRFTQNQVREGNIVNVEVKVEKLSTLRIRTEDSSGKPLPQVTVFISTISKSNNVRITNNTNEEGVYFSSSLAQGEYMVKAYLKEYMFDPSSKMVTLNQGEHIEVNIVGKKVAFSVYGKVQDFNKDGVEGATVEAYSNNQQPKETCVTDRYGNYRLRGLEPTKKYQLKVRYENQGPKYVITPQQFDIVVGKEDIQGKDFVVFQRQQVYLVQGRLLIDSTIPEEEAKKMQITSFEVFSEFNQEVPLSSVRKVQFHNYYEVELLQPHDIVVKIMVEREKEKGEQRPFQKEFIHTIRAQDMIQQNRILANSEMSRQKTSEQKAQKTTSITSPLFLIFMVMVFVYRDSIQEYFSKKLA